MGTGCSNNFVCISRSTRNNLFQLVRNERCSELDTRLNQLSHPSRYLRILNRQGHNQVSLLMVAAACGYDDIVRVLLAYDNTVDHVELKGQIFLTNEICINGASPLYCACYHGHFTVAKTLIELGHSNVDQSTNIYPVYPLLLHATMTNRIDIVTFLLENKYADINQTKSSDANQLTALMIAASRGHTSLVKYLIDTGADVNYTSSNQNSLTSTALGCALFNDHIDIVRLLHYTGADTNIIKRYGKTLLTTSVNKKHFSIVDFLLEQSIVTVEEVELTACSRISIEQTNDMLEIMRIIVRWHERSNIAKTCLMPIAVYDYQQECQTMDELDSIKDDQDRVFHEILLFRERIALSRNDISIVKPLHYYGERLVERKQFEKCLDLWIHMFYLYQTMNMPTRLHRFVWLFCRILTVNQTIPAKWFLKVGRLVFEPSHLEEKHNSATNAFFLVIIATKVLI